MPSALSTSSTPSGSALKDSTHSLQNLSFDLSEVSANTRTRGQCVPAAAEFLANRADIDRFIFRTHADAHFVVSQFFKEDRNDNAANCPEMIDQSFVVFGENREI